MHKVIDDKIIRFICWFEMSFKEKELRSDVYWSTETHITDIAKHKK